MFDYSRIPLESLVRPLVLKPIGSTLLPLPPEPDLTPGYWKWGLGADVIEIAQPTDPILGGEWKIAGEGPVPFTTYVRYNASGTWPEKYKKWSPFWSFDMPSIDYEEVDSQSIIDDDGRLINRDTEGISFYLRHDNLDPGEPFRYGDVG